MSGIERRGGKRFEPVVGDPVNTMAGEFRDILSQLPGARAALYRSHNGEPIVFQLKGTPGVYEVYRNGYNAGNIYHELFSLRHGKKVSVRTTKTYPDGRSKTTYSMEITDVDLSLRIDTDARTGFGFINPGAIELSSSNDQGKFRKSKQPVEDARKLLDVFKARVPQII